MRYGRTLMAETVTPLDAFCEIMTKGEGTKTRLLQQSDKAKEDPA
jgi:hypothetical protein